jgi:hypothetical protein
MNSSDVMRIRKRAPHRFILRARAALVSKFGSVWGVRQGVLAPGESGLPRL